MRKMDSRVNTTFPMMENLQPLDFTASPTYEGQELKRETEAEAEPPVLDLSCKRYSSQGTVDYSERIAAHPSTDENVNPDHYIDTERKSPFEGRSYMVTPPSEGDSPRKTKYEPIYNQINSTTSDLSMPVYPVVPLRMTATLTASPNQVSTGLAGLVGQSHQILQNQPAGVQMQTPDHHRIGIVSTPTQSPEMAKKVPRPFKAYPKDPLSLTMGTTELICDQTSNEAYSEFRKRMLESVKKTNEGTNIKMRRTTKSPGLPTSTMDEKDAAYWERRRKNNEAAKRSRDARRAKEDEIAIRAAFLEQENIKLKYELVALRNETAKLRCMVYSN
ncbi:uncharacterized protein LOC105685138 [Athalia rosae]|uniref:uncharacterized protein LOC105685138 n=1 Tax=Athalia rosae TaxID=37344 RepID=UPI002033C836|nr:uncharacterized protein LOC105685138 [Athalia rosae]